MADNHPGIRTVATLRRPREIVKKRTGPLFSEDVLNELGAAAALPTTTTTTAAPAAQSQIGNIVTSPSCMQQHQQQQRRTPAVKEKKEKKRERWLLTRKTWKYMADAGRKLIPDGALGNRTEDIGKCERQFHNLCAAEPRFILWRRKASYPGATRNSKRRLKLLLSHANKSTIIDDEEAESRNADRIIDLLQSYLKLDESRKTTALLGTKTVRPDQTASPSAQRPTTKQNTSTVTSSSRGPGFLPPQPPPKGISSLSEIDQLLERLRYYSRSSVVSSSRTIIPLEHITPAILEDKALLKQIYNELKKQQLHRVLSRHSPQLPLRPNLPHSLSLSTLWHFKREPQPTTLPRRPPPAEGVTPLSPPGDRMTHSSSTTTTTAVVGFVDEGTSMDKDSPFNSFTTARTGQINFQRRQRIPPSTLDLPGVELSSTYAPRPAIPVISIKKPSVEKTYSSCGTQTNFIQLHEIERLAKEYKEHKHEEELTAAGGSALSSENEGDMSQHGGGGKRILGGGHSRRRSSIDNEDVSQSVSDTIKRYLRMARKKSVHDDSANRFQRVNYDRHLRNIRAKGEINPPGMDEGNNKSAQTLDAWPLLMLDFIRGNVNPSFLDEAHADWSRALNDRLQQKLQYDEKIKQLGKQLQPQQHQHNRPHSSSSSAPTSPTSHPTTTTMAGSLLHSSTQFLSNLWHGAGGGHAEQQSPYSQSSTALRHSNNSINATGQTYNIQKHVKKQPRDDGTTAAEDVEAMQKSKSSSNVGQFVSKKIWKSRSKSQTRTSTSLLLATKPEWTPTGNCTWTSVTGQQVTLSDVVLHNLSEVEMKILQRVAIEKINQLNIGVSVAIPSDGEMTGGAATTKSAKRRPLAKKKAMTTSFFDIGKKDDKNSHVGVFGNSLENCIANEQKRRDNLTASSTDRGSRNSITSLFRGSSSSSSKANDNVRSCQSLSSKSFSMSSSALHQPMDAVNTSKTMSSQQMYRSQWDVRRSSQDNDDMQLSDFTIAPPPPVTARRQVPNFVSSCIRHLEENGLHSVGIFRVSTSMKRVRQMREEFDRSSNTVIGADTCPHDVATLLKEFLRDLPEPLLCRCLYKAFVKTQKIRNRRLQLEAISHLVQLLPIAHRDTLYVLLKFLAKVAACSDDVVTSGGVIQINGNKMDSNNLATVFAPNILRLGSRMDGVGTTIEAKEAEQESMTDVINVIRTMIDHCDELFRVSAELMDEVYTNMIDTFPQQLNSLCERRHITDLDGIDSTSSGTPLSSPPPPTNIEHLGGGGVRRQNPFSQQHQLEIFGSDFSDVMCPTSDPTMTTAKLQQAAALSPSTAGSHQQRQRNIPHDGDLSLSPAPKLSPARKVYSRESVMHENAASKGGNSTAAGSSSSRRRITKQKYSESDSAAHRSLGVGSGRGSGGGTTSRGTPSNSDNLNTPTMTTTTTVTTVRKRNTTEQSTDNDFHSMSDYSISHYPLHRHQQHQQQPHQQILSKMQQQNVRPFSGGGTTVKTTTGSASDFAAAATVTTATPANRRLSSPYVLGRSSGIVTASLQIPVQMQSAQPSDMKDKGVIRRTAATSGNDQLDLTDIPYIEDYGCDQEFENWNEGFPVTGSLSFGPGPSSNYPRKLSSSGPTVFQIPIEYEGQQRTQQLAAGAPSSSEATSLNPASKFKSFLSHGSSVYPLSASSIGASAHSSATAEPKLPTSISNIGGAILRSKTADFERMSSTPDTQILRTSQSTAIATTTSKTIENKKSSDDAAAALPSDLNVRDRQRSTRSQTPLYKRQELISSAKRHNKF